MSQPEPSAIAEAHNERELNAAFLLAAPMTAMAAEKTDVASIMLMTRSAGYPSSVKVEESQATQ